MLKLKYLDNPGTIIKCTALTFSLNSWYIFWKKKSQPKVHPDVTISCYRTIIPPTKTYKPNSISAQLFGCISDQTTFVIEGRNVSLHVAPDETNFMKIDQIWRKFEMLEHLLTLWEFHTVSLFARVKCKSYYTHQLADSASAIVPWVSKKVTLFVTAGCQLLYRKIYG